MGFISKFLAAYASKMWVKGVSWAVVALVSILLTTVGAQAYLVRKYKRAFLRKSIENVHLNAKLRDKDFEHAIALRKLRLKRLESIGVASDKRRAAILTSISKIEKEREKQKPVLAKKLKKLSEMSFEQLLANRQDLLTSTKEKKR